MGSRHRGRVYAMQALFSWDANPCDALELCRLAWLEPEQANDESAAFARLLIAGTLERIDEVDEIIRSHLLHWRIERLARVDLAILRLSTYSLLHQRDIPAGVTIDEAVDLAREYGTDDSYRFVNGVLDSIRADGAS